MMCLAVALPVECQVKSDCRTRRKVMIERTCQRCLHFIDDPASIEAEIPNLTIFGSAYSSARGHAGICYKFGLFMDPLPAQDCPSFTLHGKSNREE
jgi:hypothetical protein